MKRDFVVQKICEYATSSDILIFGSKELAAEAYHMYQPGHFYVLDYHGLSLAFALGLSYGTDKRVFVFVGEGEVLRNFGVLSQIAFSRKQNLFVILLNNGCYQSAGGFPNVFNSAHSVNSLMFDFGCRSFMLTHDFEQKRYSLIKTFFDRGQGPMIVEIKVDKSKNYNVEPRNNLDEFLSFVRDSSIKSSLYNPFVELPSHILASILNKQE